MTLPKVLFVILVVYILNLKGNSEGGWFIPQPDGSIQWVTEIQANTILREEIKKYSSDTEVKYLLYTRGNQKVPHELKADDLDTIVESLFNKDKPTRIIVHGYLDTCESEVNIKIRDAFLSVDEYNVIVVDWSYASMNSYVNAVLCVPNVGKDLAKFIDCFTTAGYITLSYLTLVGHGLGAHVCGIAGKNVQSGKINTIVGLDPALGMYSIDETERRLCLNDASYVESIHTNGGMRGFMIPIGNAAFYPNGGEVQTGCYFDISGACSHKRSYEFYAEAIESNNFPCYKCLNYESAKARLCEYYPQKLVKMGCPTNYEIARGVYFVKVNSNSPYGKQVE